MTEKENDIESAIRQICEEKNISYESVINTIEAALAVAYRKDFGEKNQNIESDFDSQTGGARVFDVKAVVENALYKKYVKEREEAEKARVEAEARGETIAEEKDEPQPRPRNTEEKKEGTEEEEEPHFDPKTMIAEEEAQELKKGAKVGDVIRTELFPPAAYGRMAAQTAKQVVIQRLREAERENMYNEYKQLEGQIITGFVQRVEGRMVLVDLGRATALMPPPEQIPAENYRPGSRFKFYLASVSETPRGPEIIASRAHADIVKLLFATEVPEIASGAVEIKAIAREAGSRTKIAVASNQKNIDPVGSCVGQRGTRVQTIITEIGGEKIDIIEFSDDSVQFLTNALSPAKVLSIKLNEEGKIATAEVKEDQLSLAIGRNGQNVRLAAKLTGWKIDIVSDNGASPESLKDGEKKPTSADKSADKGESAVVPEGEGGEKKEEAPIEEVQPKEPPQEEPSSAPASAEASADKEAQVDEEKKS
ncbi:MAG: transcription termination factor NusA [Patescibacteria group bacterium]|jgi:N utilization substance protein A